MSWQDGKLLNASIRSILGSPCKLRYRDKAVGFATSSGKSYQFGAELKLEGAS